MLADSFLCIKIINVNINIENTIEEIWKDIPNHDGYQASNFGNIKSVVNGAEKILKHNLQTKGYRMVSIKPKAKLVHRLVAFAFIPNPENKRYINHIDGDKQNNIVSNLEWCTNSENMKHAFMMGLWKPNGRKSNISDIDILDIRSSKLKASELAKIYNLSRPYICNIISGRRLKHVVYF